MRGGRFLLRPHTLVFCLEVADEEAGEVYYLGEHESRLHVRHPSGPFDDPSASISTGF